MYLGAGEFDDFLVSMEHTYIMDKNNFAQSPDLRVDIKSRHHFSVMILYSIRVMCVLAVLHLCICASRTCTLTGAAISVSGGSKVRKLDRNQQHLLTC